MTPAEQLRADALDASRRVLVIRALPEPTDRDLVLAVTQEKRAALFLRCADVAERIDAQDAVVASASCVAS